MIQPNQINEHATIETLSSFLKLLTIEQIDVLLQALPEIYASPVTSPKYTKEVMAQVLSIRRGQLIQRKERGQSYENQIFSFSFSWQPNWLDWLRFPFASNQQAYKSPKMEEHKLQSHKHGNQEADGQDQQSSLFQPSQYMRSTSDENKKKK